MVYPLYRPIRRPGLLQPHRGPGEQPTPKRKGSGSLCRLTVFVRDENVVRLLEFLGYRLE
jgi:hypothetical protein